MITTVLINTRLIAVGMMISLLTGCLSHIDKVAPQEDIPTMKEIYENETGAGGIEELQQREADIRARPVQDEDYMTDMRPHPERIQHLFPALPNPELYMYVKPHVVGASGAAVPAYLTRFTMYERTHYAMPNEVVSQVKHPGVVKREKKPASAIDAEKKDPCQPLVLCE